MATVEPITKESAALIALLTPPSGAKSSPLTDECYAIAAQVHALVAKVQARADELNAAVRAANATEESPEVFALFPRVTSKTGAIRDNCQKMNKALDDLCDTMWSLDQWASAMNVSIDGRQARVDRAAEAALRQRAAQDPRRDPSLMLPNTK